MATIEKNTVNLSADKPKEKVPEGPSLLEKLRERAQHNLKEMEEERRVMEAGKNKKPKLGILKSSKFKLKRDKVD